MKQTMHDQLNKEFRSSELFNQAVASGLDYLQSIQDRAVYPTPEAEASLKQFDEPLPESLGDAHQVIDQLHKVGMDTTVASIGPRYFGFVTGGVVPVGLGARVLTDFWDQGTALYVMSPLALTLETVVEDWVRDLLALPEKTVAGFVSGSSVAIICGLAAGRYRLYERLGYDINRKGLVGAPKLRLVTGDHTHSSVVKAVGLLGFGTDCVESIDVDDQGRIRADEVPELDDRTILILQAGNVNSGAFDDFATLCQKANDAGAWVHIDGAFGLWAGACESLKHLTTGMDLAQSYSVDGHKTLNTPYDNGLVLCQDGDALRAALQASGSYLQVSDNRDGMFYTPEMSRRARVFELWAILKYLGREGVDQLVTGLHLRAKQFAEELSSAGFQVLNDVVFNQVLVAAETDAETRAVLKAIQESGECWCGGAKWFGRDVIRISVCNWMTTPADVSRSVAAFVAARDGGPF